MECFAKLMPVLIRVLSMAFKLQQQQQQKQPPASAPGPGIPEGSVLGRYEELGKAVLGDKAGFWAVATTQFILLVGLMVTYMVTAGQSLQAASNPNCNDHTMQVRLLTKPIDCPSS